MNCPICNDLIEEQEVKSSNHLSFIAYKCNKLTKDYKFNHYAGYSSSLNEQPYLEAANIDLNNDIISFSKNEGGTSIICNYPFKVLYNGPMKIDFNKLKSIDYIRKLLALL